MNNKLIIAAAGSGKTTFLIEEALKKKENVLITTFTESNEEEIRKKFFKIKGYIPKNITIQTWFSFLLQHGVKPYQGGIYEKRVNGLLLVESKSAIKRKMGKFNQYYKEEEIEKHYFSPTGKIYSDKLSRFVIKCDKTSKGKVLNRLSKIYKNIFIDEIQDLAGYDLDVIKLLFDSKSNILLVGDPRQVTYLTHFSTKYKKYKNGEIKTFIEEEYLNNTKSCDIDTTSFNHSYRNNQIICNFSSKLYPELPTPDSKQKDKTEHEGIFLIKNNEIEKYISEYNPKILRYREAKEGELTFGYSKGLGFDRVLIYPTDKIKDYLKDGNIDNIKTVIPKFYVALTRAKFSVGIVYDYKDEDIFIEGIQKWK